MMIDIGDYDFEITYFDLLFYSANGYEKLSELDVSNNDVLVLRIEGFYPETILEKKLYVPTQLQTDRGSAKFYTILKYLVRIIMGKRIIATCFLNLGFF